MSSLYEQALPSARARHASSRLDVLRRLEAELRPLHELSRLLPALTARGATGERQRLVHALENGETVQPQPVACEVPNLLAARNRVDHLLRDVQWLPMSLLYRARLEELALELAMLDHLGNAKAVRPLSARRYGRGTEEIHVGSRVVPIYVLAQRILNRVPPSPREPPTLPAAARRGEPSLTALAQACLAEVGLSADVVVDPRLVAGAAAGERTVFVAEGPFGACEATRLCVHEVLGHLTAAANGRTQPLRILEWGTAEAFTDQEGLALYLEDTYGVLDSHRLRVLAARVLATMSMHQGASFTHVARSLHRDDGLSAEEAIAITQRAFRGGGVARDVAYLRGFVSVSREMARGTVTVDRLRAGRLSLAVLPLVTELEQLGLARKAAYRPNLARSFFSTRAGTTPCKLPPNAAASLINDELT